MALTRNFKDTVREHAQRDRDFRMELPKQVIAALLSGELEVRPAR